MFRAHFNTFSASFTFLLIHHCNSVYNINGTKGTNFGSGYNGFPQGCSDDDFPWNRDESLGETKYNFVVHAELNAILNAGGKSLVGSRIFVSLFPCHECAKAIIQSGVKEVVYLSDKYNGTVSDNASKRMLQAAGIKLTKMKPTKAQIVLNFDVQ